MRAPRIRFFLLGGLRLVCAIAFLFASVRPPVSMTVLGYTTNQWSVDSKGNPDIGATILLTNAGVRPIVYWAFAGSGMYDLLYQTSTGWKDEPAGQLRCGTGLQRLTLAPSQSVTFRALVNRDKPCKVAFSYSDGRQPSRLWERLPPWLLQRLPWGKSWITVTTEPINLRRSGVPG